MEKDKKRFLCLNVEEGYHYVEAKDKTEAQEVVWSDNFSTKIVGEVEQTNDIDQTHS